MSLVKSATFPLSVGFGLNTMIYLQQIMLDKLPSALNPCAPISELPSNLSTMVKVEGKFDPDTDVTVVESNQTAKQKYIFFY